MSPKHGVDPNSYELAEYFLPDARKEEVMDLAVVIQTAIEDWFESREVTA